MAFPWRAARTSTVLLGSLLGLTAACDKASMPRMVFDRPATAVAPMSLTVVLDPDLHQASFQQYVCDNQLWQGALGPALAKQLEHTGQTRVRHILVTTPNSPAADRSAPTDYQVILRLLQHELVAKDRTGSTDQYQARLHVDLAATYQAVLADGSVQALGEGPLRFSENFGIFTPRVGQAGGRCLTNSLDTALDKAAESLADQLFGVAAQLPVGGPAAGATAAQPAASVPPPKAPQPATSAIPVAPRVQSPSAGESPAPAGRLVTQPPDDPTYAVVIGIRSYRKNWPHPGPSFEIDQLVRTFREHVGVPVDHLMVLEDELANRLDIEEAISQWLAARATSRSVVYVYFSGQAALDPQSGDVYLAPYDAAPHDAPSRFVSLRRLQTHLARINAKLALAFLDAPLTPLAIASGGKTPKSGPLATPNWRGALTNPSEGQGVILQFARNGERPSPSHLLVGLRGDADHDRNGRVTAGELLRFLKGHTLTAPLISTSAPILDTVLSKPTP